MIIRMLQRLVAAGVVDWSIRSLPVFIEKPFFFHFLNIQVP